MPSIMDRIVRGLGYIKSPDVTPEWYLAAAEGRTYGGIPDPSIYANQADFYRKLSWINIAVSIVSYTAATVHYQVKKLVNDEPQQIINHELEKLLRSPNPEQSKFDFFQHIYAYLLLTGNAYVHLIRLSEMDKPSEMWVIPSGNITPVLSEKMGVSHYMYDSGNGRQVKIPKHQILHIKKFNPNNMFVGLSPVESISTVAHADLKMQEWNANFFSKQNAKIPGALAFKDNIDNGTFEKVKREVQEQWGGTGRYGPMLLRNVGTGINWIQMGMSQADMEFIRGRGMNRDEIFSVYAPGLLTMVSPDATEATARIGKAAFTEYTIYPMLNMIAEKITNNLLPVYGEDLTFEYDDIRITDSLIELRRMREYSTTHTVNEVRKKFWDDNPLPDERGDKMPSEISSFNTSGDNTFREREGGGDTDVGRDGRTAQELKSWLNYEIKRLGKKNKRNFTFEFTAPAIQEIIAREVKSCDSEQKLRKLYSYLSDLLEIGE